MPSLYNNIRIGGIDPASFRNFGLCALEFSDGAAKLLDISLFKFLGEEKDPERFRLLYNKTQELIVNNKLNILVIEKSINAHISFVGNNITENIGVIKLCAFDNKIRLIEILPNVVKKALTDYGLSSKLDMIAKIKDMFGLEANITEHEADAAAIAIVGIYWLNSEDKRAAKASNLMTVGA